jgi:roadblock/LC7 domain-containing protein
VADKEIRVLEGHTTGSLVLAFSPDGKRLASRGGVEKQLRVYDVASGKLLHEIALPTKEGAGVVIGPRQRVCLGFSPDGQLLATPGPDNSLSIFHERSGKEIRRLPIKQAAASFAFSPDNRLVAVEDADCTVTLWEVASGTRRATLGKAHKVQTGFSMMINGGFLPETPGDGAASALAFSPDGRLLAARGSDQAIVLYDAAGGQELGQCKGHQGNITALAFAGDGRALATGSADTTALIWDLATARRKLQPVRRELTDAELPAFWDDLAARNGAKAYNAVQRLTAAPAQAVDFLKGQLRPAAPVDSQRIDALLADLASPQFAVRQKATEELEKIGELAEGALQKALEAQPGLELRQRIEHLLDQLVSNKPPADDRIRLIRALEVLERNGTPDARAILDKLAQGASPAYQTREARAVLERLGK